MRKHLNVGQSHDFIDAVSWSRKTHRITRLTDSAEGVRRYVCRALKNRK